MPKKSSKLDSSLYSSSAINEAVADFQKNGADVTFVDGVLTVSADSQSEAEMIFDEVANYIVGISVQNV